MLFDLKLPQLLTDQGSVILGRRSLNLIGFFLGIGKMLRFLLGLRDPRLFDRKRLEIYVFF